MDTTDRIEEKVRKKTQEKPFLPDDIIPNILSRLPAKNAGQCRLVCRTWRDLTSTRDFVDLHFRHSFPMILIANGKPYTFKFDQFLLDKWWELAQRKLTIHTFPFDQEIFPYEYKAIFSHAGLIVCREYFSPAVIILNPISLEKVSIFISPKLGRSEIYGVFFHPSLKEYCSLWGIDLSDDTYGQPIPIQYKMLNLGSSPIMKTICNPFTHRVKKRDSHPLFIDKYLYWMIQPEENQYTGRNDIMQFDIIGEEFSVKPCPVPVDTECNPTQTNLLNNDGTLSFIVILPSKITIWRLKDHAGQLWTAANYTLSTYNVEYIPKPIAVVDGYLALLSGKTLLVCDLMQETMKCFRIKKYYRSALFLSHQVSLASLRNCQSTIYFNEKGELDVREISSTLGCSVSLAGSPNSNSLVNVGSDSQLEGSGEESS